MNLQTVPGTEVRKQKLKETLVPFLVLAIVGSVIPAGIWWGWSKIWPVPTLLGISRFWLDVIPGVIYLPIFALYSAKLMGRYSVFSEDEEREGGKTSFMEFAKVFPWLIRLGIFLAIDFVASVFLSFTFGIALMAIFCCHQSWRRQFFSALFEMQYRKSTEEIDENSMQS